MTKTRVRISSFLPLALGVSLALLGAACRRSQTYPPPPQNHNLSNQGTPNPDSDKTAPEKAPDAPLTETDPALIPDEALILSTQNVVNLKRRGSTLFAPILGRVGFKIGDLLQVGDASLATVLCKQGTCVLGLGNYTSCCTVPCQNQVAMMRRGDPTDLPTISRKELPDSEAAALISAEKGLRSLNLGPVTTQFLITTLYSNWKLNEANTELDRLSTQLTNPNAKEELKELYPTVATRTGNMHLRFNRVEDAKKLYQLSIISSPPTADSRDRAAAHIGLAQTYKASGAKTKAVSNFETARDLYVKQGDTNAAASTERHITMTRTSPALDRRAIERTRPQVRQSP
jgi:tetratricopeptide (TPR) repeat protein